MDFNRTSQVSIFTPGHPVLEETPGDVPAPGSWAFRGGSCGEVGCTQQGEPSAGDRPVGVGGGACESLLGEWLQLPDPVGEVEVEEDGPAPGLPEVAEGEDAGAARDGDGTREEAEVGGIVVEATLEPSIR